ncbi:PREDICTED: uncharacterized protein LOC107064383 [Polistes dominula]|uniref:Uncharacterized protein LOC107064383 n=1 Tax=Polistes dominula TaxID=743375 RepID=A0ABM1HX31_POLDO|nr:PREDICTED: uncharacterized protein LOC107064383 [Polistes dominula]
MSIIDSNRLIKPELLSEYELCQILQNRCIEITNLEKLSKIELVELYKRIAMPLPQRQTGNKNCKEINKNNLNQKPMLELCGNNITIQASNKHDNSTNFCEKRRRVSQGNLIESKSLPNETKSVLKKVRLSSVSQTETDSNGINKHDIKEENEESTFAPTRKRQKITWP